MTEKVKKLYRSRTDKMIAGICGGFGEVHSIDSTLLRLGLVFVGIITAVVPLVAVYLIAWIIIPDAPAE
jgi:phage shock protein C